MPAEYSRIGQKRRNRWIIGIGILIVLINIVVLLAIYRGLETKDSIIKIWKSKYTETLNEKTIIEKKLAKLEKQQGIVYAGENGEPANPNYKRLTTIPSSHKNFDSQVAVKDHLYEISIKYNNDSKVTPEKH